jgi:isopentenyl-diphosphate Delta-isomerase
MIQVNPHLPITVATIDGQKITGHLQAISEQAAQIELKPEQPLRNLNLVESFVIHTKDKISHPIKIRGYQSDFFLIDELSRPEIQDFLHGLRKIQHITLCANEDVEHSNRNHGFFDVELPVVALPERAWDDISTSTTFLGRTFNAPIVITGMTGGVDQGTIINERLARAATDHNIPMGVGSQRLALENDAHADIFRVKKKFPNIFLIGNIGIGQLRSKNYIDLCERAVQMISADALAVHVNVLQELIQVEGDRDFTGLIDKIGHIASKLSVPLIVKEVGVGLDTVTAQRLFDAGIRCMDVGGAGGTSWAHIEGLRAKDPIIQRRGAIFRNWGIPTAKALRDLRRALPDASIIATGGIRDGLTILKALHTGANMAGIGLPLMRAALQGPESASELVGAFIDELKIAKMCSGL